MWCRTQPKRHPRACLSFLAILLLLDRDAVMAAAVGGRGPELRFTTSSKEPSVVEKQQQIATWSQPADLDDFPSGITNENSSTALYHRGVRAMLGRTQGGILGPDLIAAAGLLTRAAEEGQEDAQSSLALLAGEGLLPPGVRRGALGESDEAMATTYHHFATLSGSMLSRLALAYRAFQGGALLCERAALLYSQPAQIAVATITSYHKFNGSKILESVRLSSSPMGGAKSREMNPEARMGNGHGGQDDDRIQFMEHLADGGDPESLLAMGRLHLWGSHGVPADPLRALYYFQKAALAGNVAAMVHLGEIFTRGIGILPDVEKGMMYFEKAAAAGHVGAMNGLGYLHAQPGSGQTSNMTAAVHYFNQAAEAGHSDGHYNMGILAMMGNGIPKNLFLARRMFSHAVAKQHVLAAFQLAKMYSQGWGGEKDLCKASSLYKYAAEFGPWGVLLRRAHEHIMKETEADNAKALLYYLRASELGYEVAQSNAAWMIEQGMGVSTLLEPLARAELGVSSPSHPDKVAAIRQILSTAARRIALRLWKAASKQGSALASLRLGDAFFYGRGERRDTAAALAMYSDASRKGSSEATFNVGLILEDKRDFEGASAQYDYSLEQDPAGYLPVQLAKLRLAMKAQLQAMGLLDSVAALAGQAEGLLAHASSPLMAGRTAALSVARVTGAAVSRNRLVASLSEALAFLTERANQIASLLSQALNKVA